MEDIDINELIAEVNALRIRVGRLEAERDHGGATPANSSENTVIGLKVGNIQGPHNQPSEETGHLAPRS
jgi:hypothetical protein